MPGVDLLAPLVFKSHYQGEMIRERLGWGWGSPDGEPLYELRKSIDLFEYPFDNWPFMPRFMCHRSAVKDIVVGEDVFFILADNGVCGAYRIDTFEFLGYINPTSTSVVKCVWYLRKSSVFIITYVTEEENYDVLRAYSICEHHVLLKQFHVVVLLFSSVQFRGNSFIEYDSITGNCLIYSDPIPFNRDNHLYQLYKETERAFVKVYRVSPPYQFSESKLSYGSVLFVSVLNSFGEDKWGTDSKRSNYDSQLQDSCRDTSDKKDKNNMILNVVIIQEPISYRSHKRIQFNIPVHDSRMNVMEWTNNKLLVKQDNHNMKLYDNQGKLVEKIEGFKADVFKVVCSTNSSTVVMYSGKSGLGLLDMGQVHLRGDKSAIRINKMIDESISFEQAFPCVYPVTDTTILLFSSEIVTSSFNIKDIIPKQTKYEIIPKMQLSEKKIERKYKCQNPEVFVPVILYNIVHKSSILLTEVNRQSTSTMTIKAKFGKDKPCKWNELCLEGLLFVGSDTGIVDIYSR